MTSQLHISAGIQVLITSLSLVSCSGDRDVNAVTPVNQVSVRVEIPRQHSIEGIRVSGQVEPQTVVVLSTRMSGFISEIKVKPGDRVKKGQSLVVISNGDILAKRAQVEATIVEAEAAVRDAQKDHDRFQILYQQQSATLKEFENATLQYTVAEAKAEAARQMKNEVDAMLLYTNLMAPFPGVITQKHMDQGSLASPGTPILSMEQSGSYFVSAFISENDINNIKNGMDVEGTIKSTGKKLSGKITEISPSSQFTGGQFKIKVMVSQSESVAFHSGMHVNIHIPLKGANQQSLFVPASSIIHKDQLSGLYTIGDDQTAQLRWLKIGRTYGDEVEILSGLRAGERFILESESKLYNGVPVLVK